MEINHIPEHDLEHAPWHAQLFEADLITGALVTHMKACEEGRGEEVTKALPASPVAHLKSTGCPVGATMYVAID
eukprot:gene9399-12065_t